jgi:threonylcarbamoyladenosine tRNA methylthiotransferase MtaB
VIVGFPGETEAEFEESLDACRRAGFMKIHIFPFSAREGTPAAGFADQVDPRVRKDRCERLAELERELARDYYQALRGKRLEVLVERPCEDLPGFVRGTDRRYVPVRLPGTAADLGEFVAAVGDMPEADHLAARRWEASAVVELATNREAQNI